MALAANDRSSRNRGHESQRAWLEHGSRLPWLHWLVIGTSVIFTLLAWRYTVALVDERARARFERLTSQAVDLVHDRFDDYSDALRSGAGFLAASERVTLGEWYAYTAALELDQRFPALRAFGVAYLVAPASRDRFVRALRRDYPGSDVYPEHDGRVQLPVSLIWPSHYEEKAIGLDLAREPSRRDALRRALATGAPQMTERVSLGVSGKEGLIIMTPFSRDAGTGGEYEPARGVMLATVYASELLTGLNGDQDRRLAIRMSDQDGTVYEDANYEPAASDTRFTMEHKFSMFGRDLVFETRSTSAFHDESMFSLPSIVLAVALLIDVLIFVVIFTLIQANQRSRHYTVTLRRERRQLAGANRELSVVNAELENFGHMLSHDLRTPLNGIQLLIDCAGQDLAEANVDPAVREEIMTLLSRMERQVDRGKALIAGMLDYAGLGAGDPESSRVDVREMLVDIGEGLQLEPDRLQLPDELPVLQTCNTRLNQVFANLVGNAVKYHPTPDTARIRIEACEQRGMMRFAVDDDGAGIEPQYREKVFELFQTLQDQDDVESSGVGLSIVRKSVEQVGGTIVLEQADSGGARFVFTWPNELPGAA